MDVPYLQQRGSSWRYRRKVPPALKEALGKGELVFPLGNTKATALSRYGQIHKQAEAIFARATMPDAGNAPTAMTLYKDALAKVALLGLSDNWHGPSEPDDNEHLARDAFADTILAKYRRDEDGHPIDLSPADDALLQVTLRGSEKTRPVVTLEDARTLYLDENVKDDKKAKLQLDNIFRIIAPVVTPERPLASIRREDARAIRDRLLDGRSVETAQRYLNTIRSLFNVAIVEFELAGKVHNPFLKLPVGNKEHTVPGRTRRDSFTEQELAMTRARVLSMARPDIQLIWRMLELTGCRPSEIAGLRVADVHLRHSVPHVDVEWHDVRRIKTHSSRRKVPLLGDALDAAREAVEAAGDNKGLFPAYFRDGGPDSLSAALSKHVRACVSRLKVVPYSLRHRVDDRLELAKVQQYTIDLVMGHTAGKTGETYGGEHARLIQAKEALEAAFAPEITAKLIAITNEPPTLP